MVFAFQSLVPSMRWAIHTLAEAALGLPSHLSVPCSRVCAPAYEVLLSCAEMIALLQR